MQNPSDTHSRLIRYFSQSVFRRNTLEDILWDIASNCIRELHFEDCVVYFVDYNREILVQKAAYGPKNIDNVHIADPLEIPFGKGLVGSVALSGVAEICPDCSVDPRYIVDDAVRSSEITIPIIYQDKVLGVIDSEHSEKGFYTQEHLEILTSIASICSSKIAHTLAAQEVAELARFFEESPLPVFRIGPTGRVLQHNKAAEPILQFWGIHGQLPLNGMIMEAALQCLADGKKRKQDSEFDDHTFQLLFAPVANRGYCNVYIYDVTEITNACITAEAANQAKDDFLSVVSHEMRTPVNAILGLTTLLQKSGLRPDQLDYAKSLQFSGKNLLNLINDILDFAKVESGQLELERRAFDLHELMKSSVAAQRGKANKTKILLGVEIGNTVPQFITGDELRLLQIINNLLSNAVKFTPEGRVTLSIHENSRTDGVSSILFSVEDTGIGISEEEKERIFSPFSQANTSTSREYGGTGLGLTIVLKLVEQHGSDLMLSSTKGQGSTFSFEVAYELPKKAPEAVATPFVDTRTLLAGKRFLVVDDNPINLLICEEFLKQWGAEVKTAAQGIEAVQSFIEHDFDLVLMDLQMPICDGIEATRRIRQLEPHHSYSEHYVPIILVTADVFLKRREEAEQVGVDDFLSKPFVMEELLNKIQLAWKRKDGQ